MNERAPAKINLSLYVGTKRDDGLHEICSLFCPLTLADRLELEPSACGEDEVVCEGVDGPNLVTSAIEAFRTRLGWDGDPVRITVDKQIPVAAGLGGGSGDAAAALRLLVGASGVTPRPAELAELAIELGADVPSQLEPGLALVTGAGETIEPLGSNFELHALLLVARDGLSTADVYTHTDSMFPGRSSEGLRELAEQLRAAVAAANGSALALGGLLHNDLQGSTVALEPSAGEALDLLREAGARAALTTGSGPTVFGLFESAADANAAGERLEAQWDGDVLAVEAGSTQ